MGVGRSPCFAPRLPKRPDLCRLILETSEGVKEPAMSGFVAQCTLVVLAMDLDQRTANLFEHLHADRLIVDKSPCATIGELYAAQDEFVLHGNIIGRQKRAGWVIACDVEHSGHLALFHAMPDQRLVAASSKSQHKSVEKDRLAGTCLAREHCEPFGKINVEP